MKPRPKLRPDMRWLARADLTTVLEIESACYAWDAWSEQDFLVALRQRNCVGMGAEVYGALAGYIVYELRKRELVIRNLAVAPAMMRRGIGGAMLSYLARKLSPERRTRIVYDVADCNLAGHLFLQACGFAAEGVRHGHFKDAAGGAVDAYHFALGVEEPAGVCLGR